MVLLSFILPCFTMTALVAGESGSLDTTQVPVSQPENQIVVSATRTERALNEAPASVTVIDADEVSRRSVESPEALLKNEAGVDLVITPGGVADRVVLRGIPEGFSGNTTQYLLNGMPVDPVQIATNRTIWHLISAKDIERLEVVRGPASALYGANAMGGVINIITKRGAGDPFLRLDLEGGSHDGRAVSMQGGGSFGDVDLRLSAKESRSDGYRPILESSWGGLDYDLDGRKSEYHRVNGSLSYWPSERQEIALGVYHYDQEDDWLGGHPEQRSDSSGDVADLTYRHEFGKKTRLTAKLLSLDSIGYVYMDNSYEDIPEPPLVLVDSYEDRERATNAEIQLDLHPSEANTLVVGASYSSGTWEFDSSERYSDYPQWTAHSKQSESQVSALFIQDEMRLGNGFTLTLGGRYDDFDFKGIQIDGTGRAESEESVFTPRAGLRYRIDPDTSFYASVGKGYIPANPSLIYRSGGRWLDNEALESEQTTSWEVGVNFREFNGRLSGSMAFYLSDYKDRITSVNVNADGGLCTSFPCYRQYQNIAAIRVEGAEFILNGKVGEHWRPFFNYTLNMAEILENEADPQTVGNAPAYTPKHKFNLGVSYFDNRGINARLAGRYVSTRYWSERNDERSRMDNFFVVDAKLLKAFRPGGKLPEMELSLALNNLFDEDYSEWQGELADGRNWWLGVAANF
jgi:outer membrane receptor protein involved in Fe transport